VIDGRVRKAFRVASGSGDQAVVVEIAAAGAGVAMTVYATDPPDADRLALLESDARTARGWLPAQGRALAERAPVSAAVPA
jgi:hypothetical protein